MRDLEKLMKYKLILVEDDYLFFATFSPKYQDLAVACAQRYPEAVLRDYGVEISEHNPKDKTVKKWKKTEGKSVWLKLEK